MTGFGVAAGSDILGKGPQRVAAHVLQAGFLQEGLIDFLIAQDSGALFAEVMRAAMLSPESRPRAPVLVDFGVYTRFNIPGFGQEGG